ncbi:hypothetical protein PGT21_008292 [Puccinia graminis f. sp. tritici]|uniref:Uncharacterized protein n=1 Tax=Puccinia graminis f. sp. tritici TaxID=56615 RepID=A0A5B0NUG6_PUCGR|nr:hypothetical protein PGT21_008292 [Puccinia graminis f. sp. tritici]KAA1093701.1 hypothetical protein PGTUg99_021597 [Puccinia graminis f. sp. tritici]
MKLRSFLTTVACPEMLLFALITLLEVFLWRGSLSFWPHQRAALKIVITLDQAPPSRQRINSDWLQLAQSSAITSEYKIQNTFRIQFCRRQDLESEKGRPNFGRKELFSFNQTSENPSLEANSQSAAVKISLRRAIPFFSPYTSYRQTFGDSKLFTYV